MAFGFLQMAIHPDFSRKKKKKKKGFSSFYGYYSGGEDYYTHINAGYFDFRDDRGLNCGANCSVVATDSYSNYSAGLFTRRAVDIIDNHNPANGPLFLYLAYQSVHEPAQVPISYVNPYNDTIENVQRRIFAGMLSCEDEGIGNVTSALARNQLLDNTIIVFTSDNGGPTTTSDGIGSRNWPLRGGKHSIWEGGTRIVGVFWASENILPKSLHNTTYDNLMHAADWMPTLLDGIGLDWNNLDIQFDGVSQWGGLIGTQNGPFRNNIYYDHDSLANGSTGPNIASGGEPSSWYEPVNETHVLSTSMSGRTLMELDGYNVSLYNLTNDPNEYNDISSQNPDIVNFMWNLLTEIRQSAVPEAQQDTNCSVNCTHTVYPIVGPAWEPWC
ncbi:hypothetical protein RFI_20276 [Reticulomyxa filosa]|uniref:Sulfatase N-terminal domain-containing protein n=1 Tax=Reticulomyxa filosa TaxID=46433 RepID=X6MSV1_RETFI|nr:hypothetical protein RFI_20276 [Reticulomyxa filosa]|eukprot:ETO17058.1 hypothetical protein RFI_20276 [Reticulomyxa filosa]